jgi:hypothetical protein
MVKPASERSGIVRSAANLDDRDESYMSLLSRLLAAIVATLLGASMIVAGALGMPESTWALLALGAGVILSLLAIDQAWRAIRKLG